MYKTLNSLENLILNGTLVLALHLKRKLDRMKTILFGWWEILFQQKLKTILDILLPVDTSSFWTEQLKVGIGSQIHKNSLSP